MRMKLILSAIGAIILACTAPPTEVSAASEYDDLVEKVTTKTLIHHIDNYHGQSCGSPTEDYAERWLHQFKQGDYYRGDPALHRAAVESLERAISSPKGAYAVIYEQRNSHDSRSNPYFIKVFWTESGRDSYVYRFRGAGHNRGLVIARKNDQSAPIYSATVASSTLILGGASCAPSFIFGQRVASPSDLNVSIAPAGSYVHKKLFTSSFAVEYPDQYKGLQLPDRKEALYWTPDSSPYDDFVDKITTKRLINYIKEYGRFRATCGPTDYSDNWLGTFKYPKISDSHPYHKLYIASLERAMTGQGAYAIAYEQNTTPMGTKNPYFITIYWSERKDDFEIRFYGDAPNRVASIQPKWGRSAKLYGMIAGSTGPLWGRGGCEVEFLQGNYSNGAIPTPRFNESFMPSYGGNGMKIFKSTFDVRYPYGYKGPKVPGSPTKLDYLALGDSFSSGEGDTERNGATGEKYYRYGTDVNEDKKKGRLKEKCHVSTRSYPYKLARQMGLGSGSSAEWASVACSGATMYDMNGDNAEGYEGQDSPLGRLHGQENKKVLQGMALNEMIPGRVKQIEFVKKYQPKVITLTAGGNDVDFGGKLTACAAYPTTCNWATLSKRNELKNDLRNQFDKLKDFYNEIQSASGNKAKIYVLGYPQFINGDPYARCKSTLNLDNREREMIVNAVTYYNLVIRQAAKAAGVKYIDIESSLGGHRLCDQTDSYVSGVASLRGLVFDGQELQESFHPNAKGHSAIAKRFKEELGGVSPLTYETCPKTDALYCPDLLATRKSIPDTEYFTIKDEDEDMRVVHYQSSSGQTVKGEVLVIKANEVPYKSLSPIKMTLYSDPVELGEISTNVHGALEGSVAIPSSVPAGYHTLELSGIDKDGHNLKLYQTILVKGTDPEDIDENGTPDKNQPCGAFIQAANKDEDLDGIDDACDPEVTEPILYSARNGISKLGEDEDRIYLFRNTRASSLTGVTKDYVDKSKDRDNTNALVGYTVSEDVRGLSFKKMIVAKEDKLNNDIAKGTPIILVKDLNDKCYALKPDDYLSPALKPGSNGYQPRGLTKLNNLPKGVSCDE